MKLQNLSVLFVIITIPIILLVSYYISLQVDTINMQTAYNTKLLDATKEAIDSFEINTVEWNEAYSETANSKRRDVMASINTFTTSFANSLGISGASKESILTYIPAIAYTLYDGYYIYAPSKTKEVVKDENGVAVIMSESLVNSDALQGYNKENFEKDNGKLLYECESSETTYNGQPFTLDPNNANETYSHMLKPFTSYSARYKNGETDITINYTLDNYITIYGTVDGEDKYQIKSGYLIDTTNRCPDPENLKESIWYKEISNNEPKEYTYIYDLDNNKVYFDRNKKPFQVSSTGKRTYLSDVKSAKYKKIVKDNGETIYQALNNGTIVGDKKVEYEKFYKDIYGTETDGIGIDIEKDVSARNYYYESCRFSNWVNDNLKGKIETTNIQVPDGVDRSQFKVEGDLFTNFEDESSVFNEHKREVIKQTIINNLNQAITSYSRNSPDGDYSLPVIKETDWDQILSDISIVTFVQGIPIGMKYYNNYAVATSTANKEYVNPNSIYLSAESGDDDYYHMPYCNKLTNNMIMGYRNVDYVLKSYGEEPETKFYYKHQERGKQACYYCLVQRDLFSSDGLNEDKKALHEKAYQTALARERYVSHEFR